MGFAGECFLKSILTDGLNNVFANVFLNKINIAENVCESELLCGSVCHALSTLLSLFFFSTSSSIAQDFVF